MSFATKDFKDIFKIKIKPRHDSLTDQYHRIFMVKLLLISSLVMGISWFKDSVNCLVPGMDILNRSIFRKKSKIYDVAFLFRKKVSSSMFDRVLNTPLLYIALFRI